MSFRYTNSLIGVLQHRLCLEAAHRDIARRTFTGTCSGVEVTCSGFGSVLGMRLLDAKTWEPFYRRHGAASSGKPPLDFERLAESIKAATWEAIQRVAAAKEEAHHRSLTRNRHLLAQSNLRHWYEHDSLTLHPRAVDGLKQELATPWMQAVRYGKANAERYLGRAAATRQEGGRVCILEEEDCQPSGIPIASTHLLYTATLIHLEASEADGGGDASANASRINERAVLSEQRKEMCRDEELFWERAELIRRGQLAAIPSGVKRGYTDQANTAADDVSEKIELQFTR